MTSQRCAQESGGEHVLAAVGTRDAARDMDVLRAVLGDDQLSFLGRATAPGSAPSTPSSSRRTSARWCSTARSTPQPRPTCGRIRSRPVPAGPADELEVDVDAATGGVTAGLYVSDAWPAIIAGIAELREGRGDTLTGLSFAFGPRDPEGVWPNASEAVDAVNCMDENRMTPEEVASRRAETSSSAPFLDPGVDVSAGARDTCKAWPEQPELGFPYADGIEDVPATLVVSITGDPSTPHEGGIALADTLGSAPLTVEGEQHTVVTQGNQPCVDEIVADYLVDLQVPDDGATCELVEVTG